ncbi:aminotransferase class IV [Streptomyces sp. NPDC058457]|uniref:aminotransferase class IV n=1 Tax=Streptomyces sp. NPDC058457 TaxID=3346507 RepID=UPI003658ED57
MALSGRPHGPFSARSGHRAAEGQEAADQRLGLTGREAGDVQGVRRRVEQRRAHAAVAPGPALRVRTVVYERELPHLKHLATMGLTYQRRRAREAGFDDALFVGRDGYVPEGSIWNVAFWDGEQVVWPEAAVLPGITMQLLQGGSAKAGVPWSTRRLTTDDLPSLRAAAATYSHCPAQPLAAVDDVPFPGDDTALTDALCAAWAEVPWDSI